jgi:hypothetical protein
VQAKAEMKQFEEQVTKNDEKVLHKETELKETTEKLPKHEQEVRSLGKQYQQALEEKNILAGRLQAKTELCAEVEEMRARLKQEMLGTSDYTMLGAVGYTVTCTLVLRSLHCGIANVSRPATARSTPAWATLSCSPSACPPTSASRPSAATASSSRSSRCSRSPRIGKLAIDGALRDKCAKEDEQVFGGYEEVFVEAQGGPEFGKQDAGYVCLAPPLASPCPAPPSASPGLVPPTASPCTTRVGRGTDGRHHGPTRGLLLRASAWRWRDGHTSGV